MIMYRFPTEKNFCCPVLSLIPFSLSLSTIGASSNEVRMEGRKMGIVYNPSVFLVMQLC